MTIDLERRQESRPWLRHYDYWVPPHLNYPQRPLSYILDAAVVNRRDEPATQFGHTQLTFGNIKQRVDSFAAALAQLGVAKGDRVAIMLPNCPQYVIAAFAVLRIGAVVVNVNAAYTARELAIILDDAAPSVVIALHESAALIRDLGRAIGLRAVITTSLVDFDAAASIVDSPSGAMSFVELASSSGARPPAVAIEPEDVAVLQYTGGTTGTPKGAMLTHASIFANVVQTECFLYPPYARGESRYLVVLPYTHIYAFTVCMLRAIWIGALQIIVPKFEPDVVLDAIRDRRPTNVPGVPTLFASLLGHRRRDECGLDRVRTFSTGAAPCSLALITAWEAATGRTLYEGFGLTEASPVTHMTPQLARRRPGTVGVPLPDTDVKIVDRETGNRVLDEGEVGELCIAGPQLMKGYWNNPAETRVALRPDDDGRVWLYTGDLARLDAEGFTTIVERKKRMAIVDGFNVYPSEIEQVLHGHPAVRQAAVIAVPHGYHGEVVDAYVVLNDGVSATSQELSAYCRSNLVSFKVPRAVHVRNSLPLTPVGKIAYLELRADALATLASSGHRTDLGSR